MDTIKYGSTRFAFRKSKGDAKKIVKSFDVFCQRMREELIQAVNNDKITNDYIELVTRKLGI